MSENLPASIPNSATHNPRPTKRRALNPASAQASQVEALFANPDREIKIPSSGTLAKTILAPPEIVANVQGSSAGAGSGEFHVYKASRRREYERLRVMDEEVEREEAQKAWESERERIKREDEERLARNRAKREKAKMRKGRGAVKGGTGEGDAAVEGVKKRLGPAKIADSVRGELEKDGFEERLDLPAAVEVENGITIHEDD